MRVCLVVPRYGPHILGGAEAQMRDYAEGLQARGHDVEAFATCAVDHHQWGNDVPPGTTLENGVTVHRFLVSRPRDHHLADRQAQVLGAGLRLGRAGEIAWLKNAGHSDDLLAALARETSADAYLFAPYLFSTTVFGALLHPERSIVIPCLHDEAYARFTVTQDTLRSVRGLIFNSSAERDLALTLLGELPCSRIVGEGFEVPRDAVCVDHRELDGMDTLAYAGRRERGKNYHLLLEYLSAYNVALSRRGLIGLLAMGGGPVHPPAAIRDQVADLGFVSERHKLEAMAASIATVQLSRNESFCRVLMESWLAGTPVIVDAGCAVTRSHCEESGGGVWVRNATEFAQAVDVLRSDPALRDRMASAGRRYVLDRYSVDAVLDRLERAVGALTR